MDSYLTRAKVVSPGIRSMCVTVVDYLQKKKQLKGVRLTLLKGPLFHGSLGTERKGGTGTRYPRTCPPVTYFLQLHPVLGINCPECELVGSISCSGPMPLSPFQALLSRSSLLRGGVLRERAAWLCALACPVFKANQTAPFPFSQPTALQTCWPKRPGAGVAWSRDSW